MLLYIVVIPYKNNFVCDKYVIYDENGIVYLYYLRSNDIFYLKVCQLTLDGGLLSVMRGSV